MTDAAQRFRYLDSLRLVGALIVCLYHFLEGWGDVPAVRAILTSGVEKASVMIFFLISGFVVPYAVKRRVDAREFFVRRAFRLLPLYFAALALILICGAAGLLQAWSFMPAAPGWTWLANLLVVQDFVGARPFLGVSWTLAIELIWYIAFFVAFVTLRERAAAALNLLAAIAIIALALLSLALDQRIPLGRPGMVYACALGFMIYGHAQGQIGRAALFGWVALFLGVTSFANYVAFGIFSHAQVQLAPVLISWIAAPLIFTAVILSPRLQQSQLLGAGLLPAAGIMSYSLYLLHPIALAAARQYAEGLWQAPVYVALTAVLTVAGYRLIERPALELGRRLTSGHREPEDVRLSPA